MANNNKSLMAMAINPAAIMTARGLKPDPWQAELLSCVDRQIILNCCRQAGKSTVIAALSLHEAIFKSGVTVLLMSPGQRQSAELFHKIIDGYNAIGRPIKTTYETQTKTEFENGSRIMCLPSKEETVRCYSPSLLIIDEASRVPDDLYKSVRPMLAATNGRLVALSTPFGQRGWFHEAWEGKGNWRRFKATWRDCPRIRKEHIEEERLAMGDAWVNQEYECLFTALSGLVYPDFESSRIDIWKPPLPGKGHFGGIDWGWRNPFAAIWGQLDREDVLTIQDERYLRETPLHEHAKALPKHVTWYCDPAGRTEREEFRAAGHVIREGYNDIRLGIAAITARLRTGRLKINADRCPNLWAEAKLYRYPSNEERTIVGENPIDEHNHALGALRYLISRIDVRFIAKLRKTAPSDGPIEVTSEEAIERKFAETRRKIFERSQKQATLNDDALWTSLN